MFKQVDFFSQISRSTARGTRFAPLTSVASRWWRRNRRRRRGDNRRQARRRSLPSAACFEILTRLSLDMLRYLEIQSLPSNFLLGKMCCLRRQKAFKMEIEFIGFGLVSHKIQKYLFSFLISKGAKWDVQYIYHFVFAGLKCEEERIKLPGYRYQCAHFVKW